VRRVANQPGIESARHNPPGESASGKFGVNCWGGCSILTTLKTGHCNCTHARGSATRSQISHSGLSTIDFPSRKKIAAAGFAPAAQSHSFTGSVLRLLFPSPRRVTAGDHKRDQDGNKNSKLQHVPHAFLRRPAWGGIRSCAVTPAA
jgi:hypothetical protein